MKIVPWAPSPFKELTLFRRLPAAALWAFSAPCSGRWMCVSSHRVLHGRRKEVVKEEKIELLTEGL